MLDPIQTEFEFMTDFQKKSFYASTASINGILGNLIYIIAGALFLGFSGTAEDEYIVIGSIIGILLLAMGIGQIISNYKFLKSSTLEKEIVKSLIRTSNKRYVEFLSIVYNNAKLNRKYCCFQEKEVFLSKNKQLLSKAEIENEENDMTAFMSSVLSINEIQVSNISEISHH